MSDIAEVGLEIARLTALQLLEAYASKELSPVEVVEVLLQRIDELDRSNFKLNSLITVSERAFEEAKSAERDIYKRASTQRCLGLPIVVKDNIDTKDLRTTAGSLALANSPLPKSDATVVRRLREEGAIVIGKSNLSEWSNFRGVGSSSGWSGLGGQSRNPHALDRSPGGSSSGSAAAVAAMFTPVALGSETDGSIHCPASLCGVAGFKPSVGRVSRNGVIPISTNQDTVGPLARSAEDLAFILSIIQGKDLSDEMTVSYFSSVQRSEIRAHSNLRLGIPSNHISQYSSSTLSVFENAVEALKDADIEIVEVVDSDTPLVLVEEDELTVFVYEMSIALNRYLTDRSAEGASSIAEIVQFNTTHSLQELPLFGQEYLEMATDSGKLDQFKYRAALDSNRNLARNGIDTILTRFELDAIVTPAMGPAWLIDHINGDSPSPASYSYAAVAGYPSVSVPMGTVGGLPVGLLMFSSINTDDHLIKLAEIVQKTLCIDMSPTFRENSNFA
ncbi:MAG: amidase [Acidimicrobiaceae bacterium]|nr:amidase [Acidimicrobiaceae bacterium]